MIFHRTWISEIILKRIYENFEIIHENRKDYEFTLESKMVKRKLVIKDAFFNCAKNNWLGSDSLPKQPLKFLSTNLFTGKPLPILYGDNDYCIDTNGISYLNLDIFGSSYFMLSRYEELVIKGRDIHNRFPAYLSVAKKNGFLDRPLIDEYIIVLKKIFLLIWPDLQLKRTAFKMYLSHDVDEPSRYGFKNNFKALKSMVSDVIRKRDFKNPFLNITGKLSINSSLSSRDPFNTFDWLMDTSESFDLKSAFFFITSHSNKIFDGDYSIEHPSIRRLIKAICDRGHEVGLHPSYGTYNKVGLIKEEKKILDKILLDLGIEQKKIGGRMHFLRFEMPTTLVEWERADLNYESSMGYADEAGFRCGTCFDYQAFNPLEGKKLKVIVRPLIAMECSVIDKRYMNCGVGEKALSIFTSLKQACMNVGGNYTLLWHNSRLDSNEMRNLYFNVLNY